MKLLRSKYPNIFVWNNSVSRKWESRSSSCPILKLTNSLMALTQSVIDQAILQKCSWKGNLFHIIAHLSLWTYPSIPHFRPKLQIRKILFFRLHPFCLAVKESPLSSQIFQSTYRLTPFKSSFLPIIFQSTTLLVSYPTRWSLFFIFGFLWWSSIFQHPGNREI